MDPPSRNSMWRFGYPNPVNYNDNELFCGGYAGTVQFYFKLKLENIFFLLHLYFFKFFTKKFVKILKSLKKLLKIFLQR